MTTRVSYIVHVGPDVRARGGIARAVDVYSSMISKDYRVVTIASIGRGSSSVRWLAWPVGLVRFAWHCTIERPVLAHLHIASRGSFFRKRAFGRLARLLGVPYIAHVHGGGFSQFTAEGGARRSEAVRGFLRHASVVVALSVASQQALSAISGRQDVEVLPNPVVLPEETTTGIASRRVVFAGHLVDHKGPDVLANALTLLSERGVSLKLTVAGEGPAAPLLAASRRGIDSNFVGWVAPVVLDELMRESAIFVLPSRVEGVPLALLEAMARGLACVATRVGGVPGVVSDGVDGLLVDPENPGQLADALERLLEDSVLRERLGIAARQTVVCRHAAPVVRDKVLRIYVSVGFPPLSQVPQ